MIQDVYKKSDDSKKAEIVYNLAENMNSISDIDFENLDKSFENLLEKAVKNNKSIDEINKICGI